MLTRIAILAALIVATSVVSAQEVAIGLDNARHLLGRTSFAASREEIRAFAGYSRTEAAEKIISAATAAPIAITLAPAWVVENPIAPSKLQAMSLEERQAEQRRNVEHAFQLREWWFREMLSTPTPLAEKMTLFWHNHFATSQQKVRFTPLMYRQNVTLRRNALGNFGSLLRQMARDPAMLIYLDGANSRKEQPNENFAREVMELFTLGIGNYSEKDVQEAARAFTGWSYGNRRRVASPDDNLSPRRIDRFVLDESAHDRGEKTVLGQKGNLAGEDVLPALLKIWFGRVFGLAGRIGEMARTAIAARQRALEKELDRLLKTATACPVAKALQAKLERAKHQMLTFCLFPGEVEATNNASERHLRPAVIARKVTNGYRAKWSADNEAAMRTTVDTARLKGATPYQTIRATLG